MFLRLIVAARTSRPIDRVKHAGEICRTRCRRRISGRGRSASPSLKRVVYSSSVVCAERKVTFIYSFVFTHDAYERSVEKIDERKRTEEKCSNLYKSRSPGESSTCRLGDREFSFVRRETRTIALAYYSSATTLKCFSADSFRKRTQPRFAEINESVHK